MPFSNVFFKNKTHCKIKNVKNVKSVFTSMLWVTWFLTIPMHISQTITGVSFVDDHFSGTRRALGPLCVCVCLGNSCRTK